MTYVVSNLHGRIDKWNALLERIGFGEDDLLYVVGDLVDYGEGSMELLTDMSMRINVLPIAGEHDFLAARLLNGFEKMRKNAGTPAASYIKDMTEWVRAGGQPTLDAFRELDDEMREGILDYLSDLSLYEIAEVNGESYLLFHAGCPFVEEEDAVLDEMDVDDCEPAEFLEYPIDLSLDYTAFGATVIVGHQSTAELPGGIPGRIWRGKGCICLHCGVVETDVVGCLCLETDEEIYV